LDFKTYRDDNCTYESYLNNINEAGREKLAEFRQSQYEHRQGNSYQAFVKTNIPIFKWLKR